MPWRSPVWRRPQARRAADASPCRCCRASPISTTSIPWRRSRTSSSSWCGPASRCRVADLVILPGSKATIADLAAFRAEGWDIDLAGASSAAAGACSACAAATRCSAGAIADPDGIEGPPAAVAGLGLLDVETVWPATKHLVAIAGRDAGGRRARSRLRDACRHDDGPGCGAADAAPRRRRGRRRHLAGRPGDGLLCPRPVRRRPPARGLARTARRARAARLSPTRPASRRRSTASPPISSTHLDIDALLGLRAEAATMSEHEPPQPGEDASCSRQATRKSRRARRISWAVGLGAAVAHIGVLDPRRAIDPRPGEPAARARRPSPPPASRHWASGACRRRAARRARRLPASAPGRSAAAGDDQQRREARGRQVDEIVEPRRRPAEGLVARRAVADHRIGRVDRLVERRRPAGRRRRARRPARRRRRKNSRRGFRSRPGRRRLGRASAGLRPTIIATACAPAFQPALVEAVATARDMLVQAACDAIRLEASGATSREPNGQERGARAAGRSRR